MKNSLKNNPDFIAMVEVLKDNTHCPAHRNCKQCVYAADNTMCSLMIQASKLVDAGFTRNPYRVGDTVYAVMKYLPIVKRMKIMSIRYDKKNNKSVVWFECKEFRSEQTFTFSHDDFGTHVFHNKEQAESVVNMWKQNGLR